MSSLGILSSLRIEPRWPAFRRYWATPNTLPTRPLPCWAFSRETTYAVEDCSAATENLLIAAAAHGLGSCWVAGTQQPYGPVVAKAFGAPEDRKLIAIVSFGYPAEAPEIEKRALADVLHWELF